MEWFEGTGVNAGPVKDGNPCFGLALKYDSGTDTRVATNRNPTIVEVHQSQANAGLWCRVGLLRGLDVNWGTSVHYDSGRTPSCAINNSNQVVEVHQSEWNSGLWYHVGQVNNNSISWGASHDYDTGTTPCVAMNDSGTIVEVHKSEGNAGLWYHVGQVSGNSISWGPSHKYDTGVDPSVAIDNQGTVVEVHKSEGNAGLWCHAGHVSGNSISWGPAHNYDSGATPSVAISDGGRVVEIHQSEWNDGLWCRVGTVKSDSISWAGAAHNFDSGARPSVACAGEFAVQTHLGSPSELWYSASLITDGANWMQDNFPVLWDNPLRRLVLPASHDSGMYTGTGLDILGKTQDLSIYDQLAYGVRYFDLRPGWDGADFSIYHNFIKGPELAAVLADVKRFMSEGHRELVILKFSHYRDFTDSIYQKLAQRIQESLGPWLFSSPPPDGQRLSDLTLGTFVETGGKVLVVCDGDYPITSRSKGIWVYRDSTAGDAINGDLRVYDVYSNTTDLEEMARDQFDKYKRYNGRCESDVKLPCDLFLLSWTLTPITAVWFYAKEADRILGKAVANLSIPNSHGCVPNLLYVDYVEYARATDIAIVVNRALHTTERVSSAIPVAEVAKR